MQPETNHAAPPDRGLPPVVPPTGRFLAQLFVVPALIVAFVVVLLLGANWLFGGARTPEQLDDNLACLAWRPSDDELRRLDEVSAPERPYPYEFLDRSAGDRLRSHGSAPGARPPG